MFGVTAERKMCTRGFKIRKGYNSMGEAGHTVRQKRKTKSRGNKLRIQTAGFCLSGVYFFVFARAALFCELDGAREKTAKSGHQAFVEPPVALLCVSLAPRRDFLSRPLTRSFLSCSLCSRMSRCTTQRLAEM